MCLNINLAKEAYNAAKKAKIVGEMHNYTVTNGLQVAENRAVMTSSINTCTGIVLNANDRANKMFHLAPEQQNLSMLKYYLEKSVYELQEKFGKVKAFVYGGVELDKNIPGSKESFNLYNGAATYLDELDVPLAMLCGKKRGAPHDNMYAVNNNITIWNDLFKKFIPENRKTLTQDQTLDILESHYQFVETTPEHMFLI